VQGSFFTRTAAIVFSSLALATGTILIGGCQRSGQPPISHDDYQQNKILLLEQRLNKLESEIKNKIQINGDEDKRTPLGPIRSLTFRIGTEDDRLRIYWADGTNSDLPCTKEQSIWVCG